MTLKCTFLFLVIFLNSFFCFSQDDVLLLGLPDNAVNNIENEESYLIQKKQYCLSYNSKKLISNWVAWHLDVSDFGEVGRGNDFRIDTDLPSAFYAVKKSDYQYKKYGFDRGHLCPSADRTSTKEDNSITFLMTNMIPQAPDCNRIVWKDLETFERQLALEGNELYIIAGPYGIGGTSGTGYFESIFISEDYSISIPSCCWKIILVLTSGENDIERIDSQTVVISVFIPNSQGVQGDHTWKDYITSVDFIEEKTGFDFFNSLPKEIEDALESKMFVD